MEIVALCVACAALVASSVSAIYLVRIGKRLKRLESEGVNALIQWGGVADRLSQTPLQAQSGDEDERYSPYESDDETFMSRLEALIDAHLGRRDLNVDFLAAGMMVSRSLLFNRVRRATGKGIVEYVNGVRIERSIEMMADTERSLTEIAELCGFSTLRYYSRVFKAVKGEIPSTYREKILEDKVSA